MPGIFSACCGRDATAVIVQENQHRAIPAAAAHQPVANPQVAALPHLPAAETERAIAVRRRAEIATDLATWRQQGTAREHRNEAVRKISQCIEDNATSLCLSHLDLTSLPAAIGKISQLEELTVDDNVLALLPDSLCDLHRLQRLHINHNQLEHLPNALGTMTELRAFHANDNRLATLPENIGALRNLLDLQIQNNQLQEYPAQLNTLRIGTIVLMKNNPLPAAHLEETRDEMEEIGYRGPVVYLDPDPDAEPPALGADPFRTMSDKEKIEALLEAAANMEDGWHVQPQNFQMGFRNLNKKDCLLMALEFALDSQRQLIPAISQRLINEMPADTKKFLIKGVNFKHDRVSAWSKDEGLPAKRGTAREVVEFQGSMYERNQEQNVHDRRVRGNFLRQFQLIADRVPARMTPIEASEGITHFLNPTGAQADNAALRFALTGLERVIIRNDVAAGFTLSPPQTLAMVWTHIENTDEALKALLRDALKNRLIEIGDDRICGLGLTERIIDIPTGVDWSVTNAISQEQLNIEIAKMASDISEEYEAIYGEEADNDRNAAANAGDATLAGDIEVRINEIKRDMFFAKAKVELVLLRDLDEAFVRREISNIFPSGDAMRVQL